MPDFADFQNALEDRYRLGPALGHGGTATVYIADDLRHRRKVAIKVLNPEVAAAVGTERFLREIHTAAGLTHPHILPVHDSGEAAGFLYYVMPHVEGESLRFRLKATPRFPIDVAIRITCEVADALNYAHSHHVVHRDIKPENILLEGDHAVVADFGIARAMHDAGDGTLTSTGIALGTPAYMSPEQVAGAKILDGRSDLYSLGCVLYEMLTGQQPFNGTVEELLRQHLMAEAPNITALRPGVPARIADAVKRALAKNPADRFNSVSGFADALVNPSPGKTKRVRSSSPLPRRRIALVAATALLVGALAVAIWYPRPAAPPPPTPPQHARNEIAVLPFQNLSAEGQYTYFAGGLHDELLTQLAKVKSLKVISGTSVMGYRSTSKPLTVIAQELGVGSVVEGSVQVVGNHLRVTVQLIDASTDEHLWAEHYDRTLDDAFAIQSDVAQRVVGEVGAILTAAEKGMLASAPTRDAGAYRLYLQGVEYWSRPGFREQDLRSAEQLFVRALIMDPKFALAHAALSQVHGRILWWRYDPSPARMTLQRTEAEAALKLAPDLPQAHVAMGLAHYYGRRDYRKAMDEFAIARKGLPNDAELWMLIGLVERRLGNWDEVLAAYRKSVDLNPRSADVFANLGAYTFRSLHRYADAVHAFDQALSLAPDLRGAALARGWTFILWRGELDTLRAVVGPEPAPGESEYLLLLERKPDSLLWTLRSSKVDVFDSAGGFVPNALYAAWALQLRGDHAGARSEFERARVRLELALAGSPDDWRMHAAHGQALAGLGRRDEALWEARWLKDSVIYRHDTIDGPLVAESRARILAQAGDARTALDEIERLLMQPSDLSANILRLDPAWDALRNQPRFQSLLAKYGAESQP